jgi:hypothetical protein
LPIRRPGPLPFFRRFTDPVYCFVKDSQKFQGKVFYFKVFSDLLRYWSLFDSIFFSMATKMSR